MRVSFLLATLVYLCASFPEIAWSQPRDHYPSIYGINLDPSYYEGKRIVIKGYLPGESFFHRSGLYVDYHQALIDNLGARIALEQTDIVDFAYANCGWNYVTIAGTVKIDEYSGAPRITNIQYITVYYGLDSEDKLVRA